MRILIVGGGGREHALAWKLHKSPRVKKLHVAPGNERTRFLAQNVLIKPTDIKRLIRFAKDSIDFTIVGPENPLALGIVDSFRSEGLRIFGPTKAATQITEASKASAKRFMAENHIPTAPFRIFRKYEAALNYLRKRGAPIVVKASGLAAGKGAHPCETLIEAEHALKEIMVDRIHDKAGEKVVIEEFLEGQEVSVFAFVADRYVSSLVAAVDYKQVGDGDTGSNTGGMGAYSPPVFWTPELEQQTRTTIMQPVAEAMTDRGSPYRGILYAGLILTKEGTKVLEFNCRFGDPETQVILPRLKTDLLEVMWKIAQLPRRPSLDSIAAFEWDPRYCVGVVLASAGYPTKETYDSIPIHFLHCLTSDRGVIPFHAGTEFDEKGFTYHEQVAYRTNGGRVLTLVALGDTLQDARKPIYTEIRKGDGFFEGALYRTDIPKI
ncbi:phosphoribosylamine--glycine ligase [Patescibacteria group bacterium]|nr:phosphoribosylamine--glycine ligase [Patescibacteria group bacterium]